MEECPPLETKRQRLALVGKLVLHGWEDNVRTGWFLGRVARKHVTARDRQYVPTANYVVRYTAKETDGQVDGLVACELSARNYGVGQWWVLLEPCMDTTRPPSAPGRHMCNAAGIRSSCDASLQGVQP
jgi:hypothetical protein